MKIHHVVIHELEKHSGKVGAKLTLFESTVDSSDERVIKLITELNNRYRNRSETYGVFDKENPTVFHEAFETYNKSKKVHDFINFTKISSEDLKSRIDTNAPAKGGYLIFAHYESSRNFVGVFLVRNTIGMSFKKDIKEKKFDIDDVQHIDFENLAMACRINIESFKVTNIRYLSFINQRGDDMSQYFTRWISSIDTETNETDTRLLYKLLKNLPAPIDPETNERIEQQLFLDNVYKTVKSSTGKIVNLKDLSKAFYGDSEYLYDKLEEFGFNINGEFKAHPRAMKLFVQVRAKADNIEISFPHSAYRKSVRISENNGNQIIIESKNLSEKVKQMIDGE